MHTLNVTLYHDFSKKPNMEILLFFLACKIEKLTSTWNHFTLSPSFFFPQDKNMVFTYKAKSEGTCCG